MEGDTRPAGCFALFLARHPPAPRLFRVPGIADVEEDQDLPFIAGHAGGQIRVFAARVAVAMRRRWFPVFQCESCFGFTGSLISQIRTPSSLGLSGSPPQRG